MYRSTRLAVAVLFAAAPLGAQGMSDVLRLHGFANWGAGHSDGGVYEYASKRTSVDAGSFALVFNAAPAAKVNVVGQLGFNGLGHDETEAKLDILFAQYSVSDALKLNVGRVKQPFGLFTELFDVGTARNMLALPHGIYDLSGMMGEVYNGVGLTGGVYSGDARWGLRYDAYVGDVTIQTTRPWEQDPNERTRVFHEVVGTHAVLETPIRGLSFGLSGYTGHLFDTTDVGSGERHGVSAAQVEWMRDRWTVRAELASQTEGGLREDAGYVEGTYYLTTRWQVVTRFDRSRAFGDDAIGASNALLHHSDVAGGLNFWVSPGFVLRADVHSVNGNRFIAPLGVSRLGERTHIVQVGSQFSF